MRRAAAIGAGLLLSAALLAGCGGGQKVAARVNKETITETEYYSRVRDVDAAQLASSAQQGVPRAGEYAMLAMINEKLILQLAAEKKATPTDAEVTAYAQFAKEMAKKYERELGPMQYGQAFMQITAMPFDPYRTDADWRRDARAACSFLNMASASLKLGDQDYRKAYDDLSKDPSLAGLKQQVTSQEQLHLRLIVANTPAQAQKALQALAKLPFETVALTNNDDPGLNARGGDIGVVSANRLPPDMLKAVKGLKPGEYTRKPVSMPAPGRPGAVNAVIQLVDRVPARVPTFEELRPLCQHIAIQRKDPTALDHLRTEAREFQRKADVQVNIKPYDEVVKRVLQAPAMPTGAPGAPPSAAPPSGTPPAAAPGAQPAPR